MPKPPSPDHLWNDWIDFSCLGGGAVVVLGLIAFLLPEGMLSRQQDALITSLVVLINYPHFAHSYLLFYRDFRRKAFTSMFPPVLRARYLVAGLAVPLILLGFFAVAMEESSARILGYGANLMFFLVGWHYVKQGYGILIVDTTKKHLFISDAAKKMLRWNGYACWMFAWLAANRKAYAEDYLGLSYVSFEMPPFLYYAACALALVTSVASIAYFWNVWRSNDTLPWSGVTAYLETIYMWVAFIGNNPLVFALIPTFHSLQYEAVVWRYELNAGRQLPVRHGWLGSATPLRRLAVFAAMGILLGYLGFKGVPRLLDAYVGYDHRLFGPSAFVFIFLIFINVHHYFLDNVIWRRENPDMRKYLLGRA